MSASHFDVLVVGSGHGGAQAAIALRQNGFAGSIGLAGEEPDLPYERPPLSKDYLAGAKTFDRLLFRTAAAWQARAVTLLPGCRIVAVDAVAHRVTASDGVVLGYGKLVWAAGGHARRLACPGAELAGIHTVRSRADVDRMIAELPATDRVVVIGGGYIGLEAAAVLRKLARQVTLVETLDRVLARVAGEELSRFLEAEHRAQGVDIRLRTGAVRVTGVGRVAGVELDDGTTVPADMVVAGIGIVPAVAPLSAAGAAGSNGVRVDGFCRTSLPDIYAVGDCAEHCNAFAAGAWVRIESVQNATDQATVAARHIAGIEAPYEAVPWFWSNQYDLRLKTAGLSQGHEHTVLRGDVAGRSFSLIYLRAGRVIALDSMNSPRDYVAGRKLISHARKVDPVALADIKMPLNS